MVGEMAYTKRCKWWKMGEDELCCSSSAIQTRPGPLSLLEERSKTPIVFVVSLCCRLPPTLGDTAKVYRYRRVRTRIFTKGKGKVKVESADCYADLVNNVSPFHLLAILVGVAIWFCPCSFFFFFFFLFFSFSFCHFCPGHITGTVTRRDSKLSVLLGPVV